jgi:tetratricopeptide (TPR) repeat protein
MSSSEDAVVLAEEGFEALEEGEWRHALRIARQIKPLRYSAWFELAARALWSLGRRRWALEALERGVAAAPEAQPLWHWLACYRSDNGDYEGALEAFDREAQLPGTVLLGNLLNRAIVHNRMGQYAEALALVEDIHGDPEEGPSPNHFMELRATLYAELGRHEDAVVEATSALALVQDDPELEARVLAIRAHAHLSLGESFRAREDLDAAVDLSYGNVPSFALMVARTLAFQPSGKARYFELYCSGRLDDDHDFIVRAETLADDAGEALTIIVPFVPEGSRATLKIDEAIDHGPAGETGWSYAEIDGAWVPLKGVYAVGPFHSYPRGA